MCQFNLLVDAVLTMKELEMLLWEWQQM